MTSHDELALATVRDTGSSFRTRYGELETLSLSVRYAFHCPPAAGETKEFHKTQLHETLHVYQTMATTYGFFLNSMRHLQTALAFGIVARIQEQPAQKLRPPLAKAILACRPISRYAEQRNLLQLWGAIEFLLRFYEGTFAEWYNSPLVKTLGLLQVPQTLFANLEPHLAENLRLRGCLHEYAVSAQQDYDAEMAAKERMFDGFRAFAEPLGDVRSVLEGAAFAVENWGVDEPVQQFMNRHASGPVTIRNDDFYRGWPSLIARELTGCTPESYVLTVLALSDIALNGAFLPNSFAIRGPKWTTLDAHPGWRMHRALWTLPKVGPLRTPDGYARFAQDLCAINGWPSHYDTIESCRANWGQPDKSVSPDGWLFRRALDLRAEVPCAFLSPAPWLTEGYDLTAAQMFTQLAVEFENERVFVHKDKELLTAWITQYAVDTYLRKALIGSKPVVSVPYALDSESSDALASNVDAAIQAAGVSLPPVTLRSRPRNAGTFWSEERD